MLLRFIFLDIYKEIFLNANIKQNALYLQQLTLLKSVIEIKHLSKLILAPNFCLKAEHGKTYWCL